MARRKDVIDKAGMSVGLPETIAHDEGDGIRAHAQLDANIIIRNAPDPVFVADLEGKILQANDAVYELLGFRPAELIEQSLSRFISPHETQEFLAALREVVERGVTRNARLSPRSATGEVIPTTLNASALRDVEGRAIGAIGILRDMRELDKARAYAESLIKNAPDPVFVSDLEGKILQVNDACSELLGFRPDELIEQSLSRFISPQETKEFVAALREVVERGVTRNVRLNPRSASGEVIPTTLNASALRDVAGTVIGAIGILRDMREYERVLRDLQESRRELREADKAKDQFLAIVSHELRTPLTAMLGWARLLRTGIPDAARAARGLEVIERNTKLLAQLIEDLLDVSRIVTGKLRLERRPVDPVAAVESAIEAVQGMADAKEIEIESVLDPDAGPVLADPDRLQQVVWNLLSNAIKFSLAHGLVGLCLEHTGPAARITVAGTGLGVLVVDEEGDAGEMLSMILGEAGADVPPAACADAAVAAFERFRPAVVVSDIGMPRGDGYSLIRRLRALEGDAAGTTPAVAL